MRITMTATGSSHLPPGHPPIRESRVGVLLVNLGTPEATSYWPMRRYLKQFLSDRRVIETNRVVWWFILNGIILTTRPTRSGHAYEQIWNRERDESPLKTFTRSQAEKLNAAFDGKVMVDWAMRYGLPPVATRLQALKDEGCDRILVLPLYPQYSASTVGSVMDAVGWALEKMRWQPAIRVLPPYFADEAYVATVADSLDAHIKSLSWTPDRILMAFHGLPREYLDKGDPYHCQCQKTARLLSEAVGRELTVTFQSRLGRAKWLEPATDATLQSLGQKGVRKIAVVTPGFSADNLETLEEIAIRGREDFLNAGGTHFAFLECLNDSPEGVAMLRTLLSRQLEGWIEAP